MSDTKISYQGEWPTPVYVNHARLDFNNFDLSIRFGKILGNEDGVLSVEPSATIVMSPQHAKALLLALSDNVAKYEASFAPIVHVPRAETPEPAA